MSDMDDRDLWGDDEFDRRDDEDDDDEDEDEDEDEDKFCQVRPYQSEHGGWVKRDDCARLEQECKDAKCQAELMQRATEVFREERDAALKQVEGLRDLLTRCQEHLDPHRDADLWSDVCAALGPKP